MEELKEETTTRLVESKDIHLTEDKDLFNLHLDATSLNNDKPNHIDFRFDTRRTEGIDPIYISGTISKKEESEEFTVTFNQLTLPESKLESILYLITTKSKEFFNSYQ